MAQREAQNDAQRPADCAETKVMAEAPAEERPTTVLADDAGDARAPQAGTAPLPQPAAPSAPSAGASVPGADAGDTALGRRIVRLRRAVVALAVVLVALGAGLGVLAWQVHTLSTEVSGLHAQIATIRTSISEMAAQDRDDEDASDLRAADLIDIIGESWANAQRILTARDIDPADLTLITDDGGTVINPANWTVTLVADLDEPGQVAVYLRHDSWSFF